MGKPQTAEHKANLSKSISKSIRAKMATGWSPHKPGDNATEAQRKKWRINSQQRRDAKKAAKLNGATQEAGQSFPLSIIPERMNGNGNGHAVRKPAKSYYIPKSDVSAKKMALAYELITAVRRIMDS